MRRLGGRNGGRCACHPTAFGDTNAEGVLLVDASNAFNRLNRRVALHNVSIICPSLATALINTYRGDACLC